MSANNSLAKEMAARDHSTSSWVCVASATLCLVAAWSYWPTLVEMVSAWNSRPDYSHGYLVIPLSLFFLYSRRDSLPLDEVRPSRWGGVAMVVTLVLRGLAGRYYFEPLDGWTLPLTLAAGVWMVFGGAFLKWCLPALIFLWFMVPLPYSAGLWLKVPLQAIATKMSTVLLVMLGSSAISEGNVILLGEHELFVEEACSGLRIFYGVFALAFAYVLFSTWSWWKKSLLLLAALPIAILANVTRIVVTGLLYEWVSSEFGKKFSHDLAGFFMIPLAALALWGVLIYLDKLFLLVEEVRQPLSHINPKAAEGG